MNNYDEKEKLIKDKAIELKKLFPSLQVEITFLWIWVSGDTRPYRQELKENGLRYAPKKQKWYFKGMQTYNKKSMPMDYIRLKYGTEIIDNESTIGSKPCDTTF